MVSGDSSSGGYTGPAIWLNPLQVVMQPLTVQAFVATVSGGSGTVTWSVDGIAGGNATVGTVDSSGNYTSPARAGKHVVNASVTVSDTTVFCNASVNVISSALAVAVSTGVPSGTSYIGALAFDSTTGVLYIYTSSGWVGA